MIKEIVCYRFPGFYESIFSNSDEFIDDEYELAGELEELIGQDKVEVEYEYEDFDKYKLSVGDTFMDYHIEAINDLLPTKITEDEDFKFEKINHSCIDSPQYYNYRTDYCYCDIETNEKTLQKIKEHTLKLDGAERYILKHFTSYDGFISFISNDIEYWKSLDIKDYEENMLSALLDMLVELSDPTAFERIISSTYYDVDKYYYASATIRYIGKDEQEKQRDLKILKENGFEING